MTGLRISSGDPVFAFDDTLEIVSWNAAAEELTGIDASEAVGRRCWELLGAQDRRGNLVCHAGCSNARIVREGRPVACQELVVRTATGRRALTVSTIEVERPGGRLFLHVLADPEAGTEPTTPSRLTPRQQEVLELMARGLSPREAAVWLGIRETTARNHVRAVLLELGAHSQLEAVATARRLGLVA